MKIAIMQPYIFPYLGYFQLINLVDKFVFLDDVSFIKRGWINRNTLLINNNPFLFSIPCVKVSSNKKINEIKIDNNQNWKDEFLKRIKHAYRTAPEYNNILPMIKKVINSDITLISDLTKKSIEEVLAYLEIQTEIIHSSSKYENFHIKGEDRIIDICKKENAEWYINPEGGLNLYSKEKFKKESLRINFLKSKQIKYAQFKDDFVPYLSIIDVLMFNPKQKVKEMLQGFDLI